MGNRKSKRLRKEAQACCEGDEFSTLLFHQDDADAVSRYVNAKFMSTSHVATAFFPERHKASKHRVYVLQAWLHQMTECDHVCYSAACTKFQCRVWPRENRKHLLKEVLDRMAVCKLRPDHSLWEACVVSMITGKEQKTHLAFDNAILVCWCAAVWSGAFGDGLIRTYTDGPNTVYVYGGSKYIWLAKKFIADGPRITDVIERVYLTDLYTGLRNVVSVAASFLREYEEWPEGSAWRVYEKFMLFIPWSCDNNWMEEEEVNLRAAQQASPCGGGGRVFGKMTSPVAGGRLGAFEFKNECGMREI